MPKINQKLHRKAEPLAFIPPVKAGRIRDLNSVLARILRDERLSPNRTLFASLLHRYFSLGMKDGKEVPMTAQQQIDKQLLYNLIVMQYGNPRNIQWLDREDPGPADPATQENLAVTDPIRAAFDEALRGADATIQSEV